MIGFAPSIFLLNVALGTCLLCSVALIIAWIFRNRSAPLQHTLLLSVVVLCLLTPFILLLAERFHVGVFHLPLALVENSGADAGAGSGNPFVESEDPRKRSEVKSNRQNAVKKVPAEADMTEFPTKQDVTFRDSPTDTISSRSDAPTSIAMGSLSWWSFSGIITIAVWAVGTLVSLAWLTRGWISVWKFRRTLKPVDDNRLVLAIDSLAQDLEMRSSPALFESVKAACPVSLGLVKPAIVLPKTMSLHLDDNKLEAILIHELAHIKRRDLWIGLAQRFAATIYWWNPLIHLLNRRLTALCEEICDNYVIQRNPDARVWYGPLLLDLAESCVGAVPAPAGVGLFGSARSAFELRIVRLISLLDKEQEMKTKIDRSGMVTVIVISMCMATIIFTSHVQADHEPTISISPALANSAHQENKEKTPAGVSEKEKYQKTGKTVRQSGTQIIWEKQRRGWQVGAKLLSATSKLEPGDPVVIQLVLRNTTDDKRTIILQQYDSTFPNLSDNNRINLNITGASARRHQHVLGAGEILNLRQYRVTVSTEGLLPGEYHVTTGPSFWYSEEGKPNRGTGIGRRVVIPFTLGDPEAVKFTAPPKVEDPKKRIHWGARVGGLVVGMRFPDGQSEWGTNARIKPEMFIRNVSSEPIECEYEIPPITDWNFKVVSTGGKYVRLDHVWYSGWRTRVKRALKLKPAEQVRLTGLVADQKEISGPTLQILAKKTKFKQGDPKRLITTGGSYIWSAWVTVHQKKVPDLSMIIGTNPVPFDIKATKSGH